MKRWLIALCLLIVAGCTKPQIAQVDVEVHVPGSPPSIMNIDVDAPPEEVAGVFGEMIDEALAKAPEQPGAERYEVVRLKLAFDSAKSPGYKPRVEEIKGRRGETYQASFYESVRFNAEYRVLIARDSETDEAGRPVRCVLERRVGTEAAWQDDMTLFISPRGSGTLLAKSIADRLAFQCEAAHIGLSRP